MPLKRLTVYLMNQTVTDFEDARSPDNSATAMALDNRHDIDGMFYRAPSIPKTPGWAAFVDPLLAGNLGKLQTMSASGLLLVRASGRIFGFTFGYGRSLLDLSKIEHRFGLKVALNRVDPTQLRSIDTKAFEDLVVTTTTQVSKSAELPSFGLDISRDIMRAATGVPRDTAFAKRLSGSDALVLNRDTDPETLADLCNLLLEAFEDDAYKADFGWVDQMMQVRDEKLVHTLDQLLVVELQSAHPGATHMAVPEPIDWEDINAFRIEGTRAHEYDDLDLEAYLGQLGDRCSDITLEKLKSRRVSVEFSRSSNPDARWNLYKCLVSEQRVDGALYVLIEGRWFQVSDSLVNQTDDFVNQVQEPAVRLPAAIVGEWEAAYNKRAAAESGDTILNLDAKIKRPGGASSGIEFCDLLTREGDLVHVKRKSESATLSHLFAQGSVSAVTFFTDGVYRDQVRDVISETAGQTTVDAWLELVPASDSEVDRSRYCVTFIVITNSNRTGRDWMPFFSKLNFMQQGRQLMAYGYGLSLGRVRVNSVAN